MASTYATFHYLLNYLLKGLELLK